MELITKPIHYTREGKRIFDQFCLDEDYNVPEAKDDIGRVVQGDVQVRTEDIRLVENYVRVTGKAFFRILCVTASADPKPVVLEGKIPFEEMVYVENGDGDSFFLQNVRTELTVSLVHSRKLSLRVMVEMEIERERLEDEETTVDAEGEENLYRKKQRINLLKLAVSKKDTYRIKETLTLPGTKESIGQLLISDVASRKLDLRLGEDEILIRGELLVFCMYLSADEKVDWIEQSIPYEGQISCEGVSENMYFSVHHALDDTLIDVRLDEDGEMRILGIEATLALRMNIYEEEELEILRDMYSLEQKCEFQTRQAVYEELLMQNQSRCRVTERLELPELKDDVLQIIHSQGGIQMENIQNTSEGIRVEGILHVAFLYLRADDMMPFGSWQGMVPFSYLIECSDMPEEVRNSLTYYVEQLLVTLAGSEAVEIKAVLAFDIFLRKAVAADVITEAHMSPMDLSILNEGPGIVGHIVQEKEDLWSLAKKYMTTLEGIMEVNDLESEEIKPGDKLLIFKENMSIL